MPIALIHVCTQQTWIVLILPGIAASEDVTLTIRIPPPSCGSKISVISVYE